MNTSIENGYNAFLDLLDEIKNSGELYERHDLLESMLDDVKETLALVNSDIKSKFESGEDVTGFTKKVSSRKSRSWSVDESEFEAALVYHIDSSELYEKKMIGIPAVEKKLTALKIKPAERKEILDKITKEEIKESVSIIKNK